MPEAGLRDRPACRAAGCNAASRSRTSRRSWARSRAFVHALAHRAPLPPARSSSGSAATRRCRASPRRACCASRRRARAGRGARAREPHRRPARRARRRCRCRTRRCPARRSPAIPVRASDRGDRAQARRAIPALLAVFGGAQGARTINRATLGCYDRWRDRARPRRAPRVRAAEPRRVPRRARRAAARRATRSRTSSSPYEPHMDDAARAGDARGLPRRARARSPSSRSAGVPAVLVPLPGSPSDHQTRNAQTLEQAGAAVVVRDAECDAGRGSTRSCRSCSRAPERLERDGRGGAASSAGPTPRRASPISSRSTPVPDAAGEPSIAVPALDLARPAPPAHRRRRRRRA